MDKLAGWKLGYYYNYQRKMGDAVDIANIIVDLAFGLSLDSYRNDQIDNCSTVWECGT